MSVFTMVKVVRQPLIVVVGEDRRVIEQIKQAILQQRSDQDIATFRAPQDKWVIKERRWISLAFICTDPASQESNTAARGKSQRKNKDKSKNSYRPGSSLRKMAVEIASENPGLRVVAVSSNPTVQTELREKSRCAAVLTLEELLRRMPERLPQWLATRN